MKVKNWFVIATLCAGVIAQFAPAKDKSGRTLVPVADPLDKLQGDIAAARERAAKDLDEARQALRIAAPGLAEMLQNLAEQSKQLEEETNQLEDKVAGDKKPEPDAAKALLEEQKALNKYGSSDAVASLGDILGKVLKRKKPKSKK